VYQTEFGEAWAGDSRRLLKNLPDHSVDLIFTSPPYALHTAKPYGNHQDDTYVKWFRPFAAEIFRILTSSGSFVLNIGAGWQSGVPTRSLYVYKLLLDLCEPDARRREAPRFHLAQEFFWFNPAKMPNPAQWVTVNRIRVKDAVEYVWWFSKTPNPKADNRKVLTPYSKSMQRLLSTQKYNKGRRPSGWQVSDVWAVNHGGAIPPNVLPVDLVDTPHSSPNAGMGEHLNMFVEANTSSNDAYRKRCRDNGVAAHPAMFPKALPEFFIRFLTDPEDLVVDPFAGSNTTGKTADELGRRWIAIERNRSYLESSRYRWDGLDGRKHAEIPSGSHPTGVSGGETELL
jgi:site-specific DNA-methyltransferase (cytosine-N4-specific)